MAGKLPVFKSKAFFAPMAGISDPAYRLLCSEMGAGLVVTELTSIHAIVAKEKELKEQKKKIGEFVEYSEKERPVSIQLFGHDVELAVKSARIVEPYFDVIDFNMGCPAPHITCQMAGAALLQKPGHVKELFTRLVKAVDKPVTLKVRAGINDSNKKLFLPIAKIAEEAGIKMITLHARTLNQGYSGKADWSLIKELKENVKIPVVGNGDVWSPEDAKRMIEETGCDYIMIGRGAMGNPFIFRQVNEYLETGKYEEISIQEKISAFHKYLEYSDKYNIKFASIRTQAMQFTKGLKGGSELRLRIGRAKSSEELKRIMLEAKKI